MVKFYFKVFFLAIFFVSCSGGGGGDDTGGGSSAEKRTTGTGIRLINGALDATPFSIRLNDKVIQTARFAEFTSYVSVSAGDQTFIIERANSPTVILSTISATLADNTEYTIFLYGEERTGNLKAELITDQVLRPEIGKAQFRVLHSRLEEGDIKVVNGSVSVDSIAFGSASEFKEITSGLNTFVITNDDGDTISQVAIDVPDRGEVTLLVTGSRLLGVIFTPVYKDLD